MNCADYLLKRYSPSEKPFPNLWYVQQAKTLPVGEIVQLLEPHDETKQAALHAMFTQRIEADELANCGTEVVSVTRDALGRITGHQSDYVLHKDHMEEWLFYEGRWPLPASVPLSRWWAEHSPAVEKAPSESALETFAVSQSDETPTNPNRETAPLQVSNIFQSMENLHWEEIVITMVSPEDIRVRARGKKARVTYIELGLKSRKSQRPCPKQEWQTLYTLAAGMGEIAWSDHLNGKEIQNLKHRVSNLRRCLKTYFGLREDPFKPYHQAKRYQTRFLLTREEGDLQPPQAEQ